MGRDRRRVLLHASPEGARQAFSLFASMYQAAADLHACTSERDQKKLLTLLRQYRQLITEHTAAIRAQTAREHHAGRGRSSLLPPSARRRNPSPWASCAGRQLKCLTPANSGS
jgi:hypothetical protein